MSKELKALEKLKRDLDEHYLSDTAKDTLYQIIESALKSLEIIKEKPMSVYLVQSCKGNYERYFEIARDMCLIEDVYTQEEYDLLKEVLTNE